MPDDIEIGYSSLRMLGLVAMAVIMTLLSVSIAFNWFGENSIDSFYVLIAYLGIAFFWFWGRKIHLDAADRARPGALHQPLRHPRHAYCQ
jgi:hypothetical protein